jgi:hypothetical protein
MQTVVSRGKKRGWHDCSIHTYTHTHTEQRERTMAIRLELSRVELYHPMNETRKMNTPMIMNAVHYVRV